MLRRTAWAHVTDFPLPKGTQPGSEDNKKKVAEFVQGLTGAERVEVSLNKTADGVELLDQYKIEQTMPLRAGNYISVASLSDSGAKLLGEILQGVGSGKDVTDKLEKLKQELGGGGSDDAEKSDNDKGDNPFAKGKDKKEEDGGNPFAEGGDDGEKPKGKGPQKGVNPFASKRPLPSVQVCARRLSRETDLPLREAQRYVQQIRRSSSFRQASRWMSRKIVQADNNRPYPLKDYETMCRIAWGQFPKAEAPARGRRIADGMQNYVRHRDNPGANWSGQAGVSGRDARVDEAFELGDQDFRSGEVMDPLRHGLVGQEAGAYEDGYDKAYEDIAYQSSRSKRSRRKQAATGSMTVGIAVDLFDPDGNEFLKEDLQEHVGDTGSDRDGLWNYRIERFNVGVTDIEVELWANAGGGGEEMEAEIAEDVHRHISRTIDRYGESYSADVFSSDLEKWGGRKQGEGGWSDDQRKEESSYMDYEQLPSDESRDEHRAYELGLSDASEGMRYDDKQFAFDPELKDSYAAGYSEGLKTSRSSSRRRSGRRVPLGHATRRRRSRT